MNKGVIGAGIVILMLAVFSYVYEVTVYTELLGMKIPIGKTYPLRSLSFLLGLVGIVIFGLGFVSGKTK